MSSLVGRGLALGALLLVAACGGGGGGGNSSGGGGSPPAPPPPNLAPTAEAGDNVAVDAGDLVELDGSGSRDSDGSISSFAWEQTGGAPVTLTGDATRVASFTASSFVRDEILAFSLTVTDNDGATASDTVTVTIRANPLATEVSVSGRLLPSASQSLDGDTNDPFNPLFVNDDPDRAQRVANPTTLGGYVNEPGTGEDGRSRASGDREDYFIVDLLEGQTLDLVVAEFQDADADLYLYSGTDDLVDFSITTGPRETITVPETDTYLVNVSIFRGATNYTLTIGSTLTPVASHHDDVVAGQAIVTMDEGPNLAEARRDLRHEMRLRQVGGGRSRTRLLAMEEAGSDIATLGARLGAQRHRRREFRNPSQARLWETLINIKELARRPGIRSAEPNYRVYPTASIDDEAYAFQWHYPLINLPGAWDTTTGNPSVIVAVVDTGVLGGHPDLAGQLVDGYDFISDPREAADGDGIDADPEESVGGGDPAAVNYHGSHVTGTVAAAGNNRIGVAGVAFGARVMPLRSLTATGGTLFDVNQSVRFAAGLPNDSGTVPPQPADIINLSLAGGGFSSSSQALYNELRDRGIAVVAAAGNEGSTVPSYPASYANVISVSAVDAQQRITAYSNTGGSIDVAAPGGDGSVDLNGDGYPDGVLSTGASDGEFAYTFLSGTSMASPHVAGVLALMKSVNPELDADDFDRLLVNGALTDDLGPAGRDDRYGHGLINARKAIDAAINESGGTSNVGPRLAASTTALSFGSASTRLGFTLRNSGGGELTDVSVTAQDDWITVTPGTVDAAGLGQYEVTVNRSTLAPGVYEGTITAASAPNSVSVRVLLSVSDAVESELGQIYLLLVDPVRDQPVAQAAAERAGDSYRFSFGVVAAGSYQIFAGTDLDNDLVICDAGEACGAYLTIDQPLTIEIDRDRDDLNFAIEYLIALPGAASQDGTIRQGDDFSLKRMKPKP